MAIAISLSPGSPYQSLVPQTVTWSGLANNTTYTVTVVGPQGTSDTSITSNGSGAATSTWTPDGGGTYTFYTTLISAAAAVPGGALSVESIN